MRCFKFEGIDCNRLININRDCAIGSFNRIAMGCFKFEGIDCNRLININRDSSKVRTRHSAFRARAAPRLAQHVRVERG
jgi:hypothetical protein